MTSTRAWLVVLVLLGACRRERATPAPMLEPAKAVTATAVDAGASGPGFIGVIVAGETAEIEPRAEARIEAVLVEAGDTVAEGAPLARLDLKAARHDLASARASLTEATRRYDRRRQLARSNAGAITAEELEGAERELAEARARAARLADGVADALVRAPFAGTVAERYLGPGALAGPGRPVVRVVSTGEPRVRFAVPEEQAQNLTPGRRIDVAIASLGLRLRGRVTGVSPEVDPSSRMVYATGVFDPRPVATGDTPPPRLSTGVITRVFLAEGMVVVPSEAPAPPPAAPPSAAPVPARNKAATRPRPRGKGVDKW